MVKKWVSRWQGKGKPKSMMTPEEQKEAEIQALKAQNRLLEMENDVLKKVSSIGKRNDSKRNKSRHTKRSKR